MMCEDCWREYGMPPPTAKSIAAVPLIKSVYEFHSAGGHLHVVLDDWNLGDESVSFCLSEVRTKWNVGSYFADEADKAREAELACALAFMDMTESERAAAMAIHSGLITTPQ